MPKKSRPVDRKAVRASAIEASARVSPSTIAYRTYRRKALLRFYLEGQVEAIRQHRLWLSLCESAGESTMSRKIRQAVEKEQAHVIELATALAEDVPEGLRRLLRPKSHGLTRSSDT